MARQALATKPGWPEFDLCANTVEERTHSFKLSCVCAGLSDGVSSCIREVCCQVVVVHAFEPSIWEIRAMLISESRPARAKREEGLLLLQQTVGLLACLTLVWGQPVLRSKHTAL